MKNRLTYITPEEFDIGALINSDEIFEKVRSRLRPEVILNEDLKKLITIMKMVGNSIEEIQKIDKGAAFYAMELANYVANWQVKSKAKNYETIGEECIKSNLEELIKDTLSESKRKNCDSESFRFLIACLQKFLSDKKNFEENKQTLCHAKENFESYCEMKEKV